MHLEDKIRQSRILIADDRIATVRLIENMLNRIGYRQLKCVTDPRQIFGLIDEWKPALLILDILMPEVDGFEVVDRLRNRTPRDQWIPILVVSAAPDPEARRRVLAAGSTEFLAKPFEFNELLLRIRNALMLYVLQEELRNQNQVLEYSVWARTRALTQRTAELETALSELKKSQDQIVQHERLRAFKEMAGGIAHDFNNVLMCVVGYTDLLIKNPAMLDDKEKAGELLQTINTAGHDAAKIVTRLKEFYRPREQSEVFAPVDLNILVKTVIHLTEPKWKTQALEKGCKIRIRLELNKVSTVSGNAAELREALINLIFNATDAMPEGGTITVHTYQAGTSVVLEVIDSGTGMSEEVRQKCIEPFFSTKGDGGTGLGLPMVFGIVKRHEGNIDIDTAVGKGSTFRVTLPSHTEGKQMEDILIPKGIRSLHVLVVDDDPIARDVLAQYLLADGHEVETACDGAEALERFAQKPMELVILDHAMPGMTGLQLAVTLKQLYNGLPVLMVTGFAGCAALGSGEMPKGVDIIIEKPVSQSALSKAIETLGAKSEAAPKTDFMIGQ
jgi:signal transduction histidine kinase